jgi:hypothetical protein
LALVEAARAGHCSVANLLLERAARPEEADVSGDSAFSAVSYKRLFFVFCAIAFDFYVHLLFGFYLSTSFCYLLLLPFVMPFLFPQMCFLDIALFYLHWNKWGRFACRMNLATIRER